jgi:hypothetical protein
MSTVVPIGPVQPRSGRKPKQAEPEAPTAKPSAGPSFALVPIAAASDAAAEDGNRPTRRSSASFLAQLIANHKQLPQTRERRRAEPKVALAAYGAAAKLTRRR